MIADRFDDLHPDLAPNQSQSIDCEYEFDADDPAGDLFKRHGTALSDIICAAAVGQGAMSFAHEANLIGERPEGIISDAGLATIAKSIKAATRNALSDVLDISQGIVKNPNSEFRADLLSGGRGNDVLTGGMGIDTFVFHAALATGALGNSAFTTGSVATMAAHRIGYETTTGRVYHDADGHGAAAQVHLATLDPVTGLSASGFFKVRHGAKADTDPP